MLDAGCQNTYMVRTQERKSMKQKILQVVFMVLMCASAHAVALNSTSQFNYFDTADYGVPEARYTSAVSGLFESTNSGVLVHANRFRGSPMLITKSTYYLAGGTAEFIWSGSGGTSFMQLDCGVMTQPWVTDPNNLGAGKIVTEYGGLYASSWLATLGRTYKTTVVFTTNSFSMKTTDFLTGQTMATSGGSFDFTTPVYLDFQSNDTYDNQNAYLFLQSLTLYTLIYIGPAPTPPTVVQTNRTPSSTELGTQTSGNFKVFTNGVFTNGVALDPSKKTIVLTHGWNSSSADWPSSMASQFVAAGISANIVAWDWRDDAKQFWPQTALLKTPAQGNALGTNLLQALGAGYNQSIHFIGHSFGTLVNAGAANYLHTNGFAWANTQMTLLDEAEIASDLTKVSPGAFNLGWIKPLPDNFAWADNYISLVGELHYQNNIVNVILTAGQPGVFYANADALYNDMKNYHAVPCDWYGQTVANPAGSVMGDIWSFERNSTFTSPAGGTFFDQQGSGLGLNQIQPAIADYLHQVNAAAFVRDVGVFLTLKVVNATVQVVGDVAANVIETALTDNNQVYQTTPATIGISTYAPATPDFWSPQLILQNHPFIPPAPLIAFKANTPTPKGSSSTPANSPAYAWLPMTIPTNATSMSFDFMIQGDGAGDSFEAALNGTNVFSLATSLIQTNVTMNSGLIDVSAYAGQNVELFLGIVGGNSTNTVLTVSGIRLYSIASPLLQAQTAGNNCVLSWPLSAAGYTLETSTNLISWTAVTDVQAIVNLQNAVTNSASDGARFYRLKK